VQLCKGHAGIVPATPDTDFVPQWDTLGSSDQCNVLIFRRLSDDGSSTAAVGSALSVLGWDFEGLVDQGFGSRCRLQSGGWQEVDQAGWWCETPSGQPPPWDVVVRRSGSDRRA
jgi:hypothetical protein